MARALAVLVALLTLLTAGAQALHMTLVAHHLCDVHGQVEHAHEQVRDDHQGPAGQSIATDDEHEDCDLLGVAPAALEAAPQLACPGAVERPLLPPDLVTTDLVRSVWRLAPKTSPPV